MKRIGIITMHRVPNYGSALQAYALFRIIREMGYAPELIDYRFPTPDNLQPRSLAIRIKAAIRELLALLVHPGRRRKRRRIAGFLKRNVKLSAHSYRSAAQLLQNPPRYDIYVTGSDQVWSCRHVGTDRTFLLPFAQEAAPRISYAASFGAGEVAAEAVHDYAALLGRYSRLSVREISGAEKVEALCGRRAEVVADPTLLLDAADWNAIADDSRLKIDGPYLLLYLLTYSFRPFPEINGVIERILQDFTGKVVILGERPPYPLYRDAVIIADAGPEDFVRLFRDASAVVTTSFHGTVFSLIYGKPVYATIGGKNVNDSRIHELLSRVGAEDRAVELGGGKADPPAGMPDNQEISEKLKTWRRSSHEFLREALQENEPGAQSQPQSEK